MASTTTSSRSHGGGAGGKIMRPRRRGRINTPYDRPFSNQNPNWISKFIFSPTRVIASGAGKVLSSVFGSESQHSSSSSSSSSYSASAEDIDDDEGNDTRESSQPAIELNYAKASLEMTKDVTEEPQVAIRKTDAKHLIEQLIMQETFSWDEYNRLSNILKSRIIDTPIDITRKGGEASELRERAAIGVDSDLDLPDLDCMAVMEAKNWLKEKKLASYPAPDMDQVATSTPNSLMAPQVRQLGSPVDMAKSYMKARPPWASPCFNISGQSPISSSGLQIRGEDTPFPTGTNSISSSKVQLKRDPPFSGSWNVMEEIRRVRSRATEEMLRAPSATKVDWSGPTRASSLTNYDWSGSAFVHNKTFDEAEASRGEMLKSPINLLDTPTIAASQKPLVSQERLEDEVPSSTATVSVSERIQDLEGKQIDQGKGLQAGSTDKAAVTERDSGHAGDTAILQSINQLHDVADGIGIPGRMFTTQMDFDSSFPESAPLVSDNGLAIGGASGANGFPYASLSAEADSKDFNQRPHDGGINPTGSSLPSSPPQETCELLSETSIEVPNINENDSLGNGSRNSPSMHVEEFSDDFNQQNTQQVAVRKRGSVAMKQQTQKATRYSKRSSRGKGK